MSYTNDELYNIAMYQKALIRVFALNAVLYFFLKNLIGELSDVTLQNSILFAVASILMIVLNAYYIYKLSSATKSGSSSGFIFYLILLFVPLVNLIVMLVVVNSASTVLKNNGVKVKFLGADSKEMVRLKQGIAQMDK